MAELTNETTELLAQAIRAIQYGHKSAAATYLNLILEQDPDNMDAWRWLAECMPSATKREYCLERAGLASSNDIAIRTISRRPVSAITQDHYAESAVSKTPTTLAEEHARRAAIRGQGRAELPPKYQVPLLEEPDFHKVNQAEKRSSSAGQKPQTKPPVLVRKPIKRRRNRLNGRVLLFSIGLISLTVVSGYILFSTGLTTYSQVLDWVNIQIENNADSLPSLGINPTRTPQSLFDIPAEEPDVLSTYFPTPAVTPQPEAVLPAEVAVSVENSARISAEGPSEMATDVPIEAATEAVVDVSVTEEAQVVPVVETVPQPSGFVGGPTTIGKSVKGNNIEVMQFGNGPVERMIVAGIHGGNEWNTTALADELITYLKKNPKAIPADRTLYVLRLLNPDGEERGHNLDGRTNERGVDLNRNWDADWVVDWPRDGCWNYRPISAGSEPFSEPETRALRDFLKKHNISALINYHSAALGVFAGGRPPETESVRLAKAISAVTNYAYPPQDTGCNYTGQFADWLADNGTAAVDLELTNHTDTDYEANLKVLKVLLKWEPSTGPKSLTGLINLAETTSEKPTLVEQISRFGARTLNEINGLIFGVQEEK
jgi:hypothetical protein